MPVADLATTSRFLGNILMQQKKMDEAIAVFQRAVKLSVVAVGREHPGTAKPLGNLGAVYLAKGDREKAREQFGRAMAIWDRQPQPNPVYTVTTITNLAQLYLDEGDPDWSIAMYQKVLEIQEKAFGNDSPRRANVLRKDINTLRKIGKTNEAEALGKRLKEISGQ